MWICGCPRPAGLHYMYPPRDVWMQDAALIGRHLMVCGRPRRFPTATATGSQPQQSEPQHNTGVDRLVSWSVVSCLSVSVHGQRSSDQVIHTVSHFLWFSLFLTTVLFSRCMQCLYCSRAVHCVSVCNLYCFFCGFIGCRLHFI